jgi:hypothetical protein
MYVCMSDAYTLFNSSYYHTNIVTNVCNCVTKSVRYLTFNRKDTIKSTYILTVYLHGINTFPTYLIGCCCDWVDNHQPV